MLPRFAVLLGIRRTSAAELLQSVAEWTPMEQEQEQEQERVHRFPVSVPNARSTPVHA
jgi:hypothetical protein